MQISVRNPGMQIGVWIAFVAVLFAVRISGEAHPLGNFTVSHFTRLEIGGERIRLRYVVDMAEVSTFQEIERIDTDGDRSPSPEEKEAYLRRVAAQYAGNLILSIDGARIPLSIKGHQLRLRSGDGGLPTLRVECDLLGAFPVGGAIHRLRFEDANRHERSGWRELVVQPAAGMAVFDSTGFGNGITDELNSYPQGELKTMLDERTVDLSYVAGSVVPAEARPLQMRDGRRVEMKSRDRLAELVAAPELNFRTMLWGLLIAAMLGAMHAMSPGHGKTVVGAYLVGSRGTARHAAFLGLTVTITHTAGVFAFGLVTLAGSRYLLPEKLFPLLSMASGLLVIGIGVSQIWQRIRRPIAAHQHAGGWHAHSHDDGEHAHGPEGHTHAPPERVTWRSLLMLGVSGGLLPCPSALVVLLAAVSLHRIGYGLLLVFAFSAGLAGALTLVGLAFIYARRVLHRPLQGDAGWLTRALPAASAIVITVIGAAMLWQGLAQAGFPIDAAVAKLGAVLSLR